MNTNNKKQVKALKYKALLIKQILNIYENYYAYSYEELIDAYFHLQDRNINYLRQLKHKLEQDNLSEIKHYFL